MTLDARNRQLSRRRFLGAASAVTATLALPAVARAHAEPSRLAFHHLHTGERLDLVYAEGGRYRSEALARLDAFLGDWRTGEVMPIDRTLLDLVASLRARLAPETPYELICGYRSPETNAMLRRKGRGVAKKSLHLKGMAIDLRLPGVALASLREAALARQAGGVGYYPSSNFVHIDTGRVRYW